MFDMNVGFTMRTEIANSAVNASVIFVHWSMMGLKDSTRTPSTAGEYKPRERETAQNRRLPPSEGETRVPWYQHTDAQCRHTYVNFHPHHHPYLSNRCADYGFSTGIVFIYLYIIIT